MPTYRTPDVYVEEISTFPPSVAEVETAIPAFIGYTEKAQKILATDLQGKPTKIYSFAEYQQYFGAPDAPAIAITRTTVSPGVITTTVVPPAVDHLLYYAVKMFFDNGGGKCYITSVGDYVGAMDIAELTAGLGAVALEDEPTMLVCPDALKLGGTGYNTMAQNMLVQCGSLKDRFAILDLFAGSVAQDNAALLVNRARVGNNNLKYGALYYPDLKTSFNHYLKPDESNVLVTLDAGAAVPLQAIGDPTSVAWDTSLYNLIKTLLLDHFIVVPPSGAVAGVYAAVDSSRGVWKAPANVGVADVVEPMVRLDNAHQDELNVDPTTGKSINALRAFAGKGTLVWGARTLAGNDNEWRYVPVRRFFNMVEESVKKSSYWAVFEPNDANTWVKVRGMIENYLTQKWREGALAGATTKDAFFVRCGLGTTMNAQDILEGRMHVEIGMAVVRPAEFIILKFSHKLQTS
ncbi:phage tail sheath C-terminal domain-containing protein [Sphaerotilus sp.]|uniref:phage tail sheath family protein n=1 Tax=Sphaerotilus sp. TaxID=2093942 RepID=UPI00286D7A71|nr:phage tail sheath C-terminal domain-containing protein [Sphaerotilus sp.]